MRCIGSSVFEDEPPRQSNLRRRPVDRRLIGGPVADSFQHVTSGASLASRPPMASPENSFMRDIKRVLGQHSVNTPPTSRLAPQKRQASLELEKEGPSRPARPDANNLGLTPSMEQLVVNAVDTDIPTDLNGAPLDTKRRPMVPLNGNYVTKTERIRVDGAMKEVADALKHDRPYPSN